MRCVVQLAMSSDQMASINKPLVAVTFDVSGAAGSRVVNVELTKDDIHKFITSLEAVNKVCICNPFTYSKFVAV